MASFANGIYRTPTGYVSERGSGRNVSGLATSGSVDDELWILLEYYSEVDSVGLNFIKNMGITNPSIRRKVFKHFQAHVRQAKNYYFAAKTLHPRSSGLLYYYCFLNLAKAALAIKHPQRAGKKIHHGIEYVVRYSPFNTQVIKTKTDGVFPLLFEWMFEESIAPQTFSIQALLNYCSDITYQCQISGIQDKKLIPVYLLSLIENNNKTGWPLLGFSNESVVLKYTNSVQPILNNFEKVSVTQHAAREMLGIDASEHSSLTFLQGKNVYPWLLDQYPPLLECRSEVSTVTKKIYQPNYFDSSDFYFSLPYAVNRQTRMDETLAIYLVMFYISNLVRYNPRYLESLLSKRESWLIDSFIRSCPLTFLRAMVSRIVNTDLIIKPR